ncbi:hypothetical protein [Pontibacter mangrovi]|uniref:Uncharacterized protein n=1 Tax=Pontibacter mangrovi TaxID=2589816 RepID=A0A501W6I3_9BACT|nr:hypothetical protein [Pontibacter mangrovi]TPE44245.1 hypothetical protein FJM65_08775 [Pontibacter mangrovi]
MKTSNKLLLAAVLVLLASLAVYNVALTAEYKKGGFKNPFAGYEARGLKDFQEVSVNVGNSMSVEIVPGDFEVRVLDKVADYVKAEVRGEELVLEVAYPEEYSMPSAGPHVIISCPDLTTLKTNAVYTAGGKKIEEKAYKEWSMVHNAVTLKEMELDSLTILQDNGSAVILQGNKIGHLQATAGISSGSSPKLTVANGNTIQSAQLDIRSGSELVLDNVSIPNLTYSFSDSAKTVLSGASLRVLRQ